MTTQNMRVWKKQASLLRKLKSILSKVIFVPRKYLNILYIFLFFTLDAHTHTIGNILKRRNGDKKKGSFHLIKSVIN